jgi:hypothetical protein
MLLAHVPISNSAGVKDPPQIINLNRDNALRDGRAVVVWVDVGRKMVWLKWMNMFSLCQVGMVE